MPTGISFAPARAQSILRVSSHNVHTLSVRARSRQMRYEASRPPCAGILFEPLRPNRTFYSSRSPCSHAFRSSPLEPSVFGGVRPPCSQAFRANQFEPNACEKVQHTLLKCIPLSPLEPMKFETCRPRGSYSIGSKPLELNVI